MHRVSLTCKTIIRPYPCFFAVIMFFLSFHGHFMLLRTLPFLSAFRSVTPWNLASCPSLMHAWKSLPPASFHLISPSTHHFPLLRSWGSHRSPRVQRTLVKSNSWSHSPWPKWLVPTTGWACDQTCLGLLGTDAFYFYFCGVSGWQDMSLGVSPSIHPF